MVKKKKEKFFSQKALKAFAKAGVLDTVFITPFGGSKRLDSPLKIGILSGNIKKLSFKEFEKLTGFDTSRFR